MKNRKIVTTNTDGLPTFFGFLQIPHRITFHIVLSFTTMKMKIISSRKRTEMIPTMMSSSISSTQVTSSDYSRDQEEYSMIFDQKLIFQLENFDDDLNDIIRKPNTIANQSPDDKNRSETNASAISRIASVDRNDLQQISLIGSGQFCNVYSVVGILSQKNKNEDRESPRKRSLLAFKSINTSRVKNSEDFAVAATDLANEAKILSQLNHKNIIKLRGISSQRFSQSFFPDGESSGGFFLVLEILKETLDQRLDYWRKNRRHLERQTRSMPSLKSSSLREPFSLQQGSNTLKSWRTKNTDDHQSKIMYQRVKKIVLGIAEGMEYLHSNQIVLRDLKPGNIGFDFEHGTDIRLFDFGMARRVSECIPNEICGSPRYMAPEAMSGEGYSLKVDSFSFGTILFEICSLHSPYADNYWKHKKKIYNRNATWSKFKRFGSKSNQVKSKQSMMEDFYSCVVEGKLLPSDNLDSTIPCPKIQDLISECWKRNPDDRPSFTEIISRLKVIFES